MPIQQSSVLAHSGTELWALQLRLVSTRNAPSSSSRGGSSASFSVAILLNPTWGQGAKFESGAAPRLSAHRLVGANSFLRLFAEMTEKKDLDEEFKQYVSDMKPHTKVLPYKSGLDERATGFSDSK